MSEPKPTIDLAVKLNPNAEPEGEKVVDWAIKLSKDTPADQILKDLLDSVESHDFDDDMETTALPYKWFESTEEEDVFNFVVFRQTDSTLEGANEVPSRTSGPKPPKPPSGVLEIVDKAALNNDSTLESVDDDDEVPTRTSGPKPPKPPSEA